MIGVLTTKMSKVQGSNCSSVHNWRGLCIVPSWVDRVLAVEVGWKRTGAKDR